MGWAEEAGGWTYIAKRIHIEGPPEVSVAVGSCTCRAFRTFPGIMTDLAYMAHEGLSVLLLAFLNIFFDQLLQSILASYPLDRRRKSNLLLQ